MALKYQALNGYVNTVEIKGFTPLGNGVGSLTTFFKPSAEHQGFYLYDTYSSSSLSSFNAYGETNVPSDNQMSTKSYVFTYDGVKYQISNTNKFGFATSSAYTGQITFKVKVIKATENNITTEEFTKTITCTNSKYISISIPYSTAATVGFFVETVY